MAKRYDSFDDLGLCLTGSQVGIQASSSRSGHVTPKMPGRPSSSSGASGRVKASPKKVRDGIGSATDRTRKPSGGQPSNARPYSDIGDNRTSSAAGKAASDRDDYLALFENSHQPKIVRPKQALKSNMQSKPTTTGGPSFFSHSIFQPVSARTVSTLNEDLNLSDDETGHNTKNAVASDAVVGLKNTNYDSFFSSSGRFKPSEPGGIVETKDNEMQRERTRQNLGPNGDSGSARMPASATDSQKYKTDGIANNMTSQAHRPGTKASLSSMENAYQNIKHKTPVNQVRQKTTTSGSTSVAEDYVKSCNMSATKIQRWFRRRRMRRREAEESVRRMLDTKRRELESTTMSNDRTTPMLQVRTEAEQKSRREEKAKQSRQVAIQELQKKREEKRQNQQKLVDEEMSFLQSNGRVSKTPSHKSSNIKKMELIRSNSNQPNAPSGAATQDLKQRPGSSGGNRGSKSQIDDHIATDSSTSLKSSNPEKQYGGESVASSSTTNEAKRKTTIEDILETLKKLEEDEDPTKNAKNKRTPSGLEWLDELDKTNFRSDHDRGNVSDDHYRSSSRSNPSKDNVVQSGLLSEEKLSSIMNYLEKVEANDRLTEIDQELQKMNETLEKPVMLVPSSEEIAQMELASQAASEVTQQMLNQKMELEEKKRKLQTLEKALNQQRDLTVRYAKETEGEMKKRLEVQKQHHDEAVGRHLSFIDQLIEDKKQLTERSETLQKQLKTVTQTIHDKMKTMEESHAIELQKLKEIHSATDKLKRERWVKEETKKIKECTIKGFEPELHRIIAQHKADIKKMKAIHDAELLASDERAGQRYVRMTEELRDQLAKEKESACARERDLARQMYEKQLQQEEEILQQQRQRLYNEIREEKERLAQTAQKQRIDLDRQQNKIEETQSIAMDTLRKEYEMSRKEQESRHASEIRQLRDQLSIEKDAWEENYRKKQETLLMQKEREMREQVKKDRDREIELAMNGLAEDSQTEINQCKKDTENQIRRLREKYDREMAELERSERQMAEKYNQTKAKLLEIEGENERNKVTLKQRELDADELKSLLNKRNEERDHISDIIRQEFADRIVALDDENRKLKNEMSELKARQRLELERTRSECEVKMKAKEDEMEEIHRRVKEAIAKKDKQYEELCQQRDAAMKRADYSEQLLLEQRKLLGKK